jgi:hypothetical protein
MFDFNEVIKKQLDLTQKTLDEIRKANETLYAILHILIDKHKGTEDGK